MDILFEPEIINDLVRVMASAIDTYTRDYSKLKASMADAYRTVLSGRKNSLSIYRYV